MNTSRIILTDDELTPEEKTLKNEFIGWITQYREKKQIKKTSINTYIDSQYKKKYKDKIENDPECFPEKYKKFLKVNGIIYSPVYKNSDRISSVQLVRESDDKIIFEYFPKTFGEKKPRNQVKSLKFHGTTRKSKIETAANEEPVQNKTPYKINSFIVYGSQQKKRKRKDKKDPNKENPNKSNKIGNESPVITEKSLNVVRMDIIDNVMPVSTPQQNESNVTITNKPDLDLTITANQNTTPEKSFYDDYYFDDNFSCEVPNWHELFPEDIIEDKQINKTHQQTFSNHDATIPSMITTPAKKSPAVVNVINVNESSGSLPTSAFGLFNPNNVTNDMTRKLKNTRPQNSLNYYSDEEIFGGFSGLSMVADQITHERPAEKLNSTKNSLTYSSDEDTFGYVFPELSMVAAQIKRTPGNK